ncbi:ABC transporter permease [Bacteroidota bacterium]
MFVNYLKTALRNLLRQKSYSIINIGGLAIGMSVCILILSYVFFELSYDKFHEKSDQIYRVGLNATIGGNIMNLAVTSAPMGEALREDFPEVIANTRLSTSETLELNIEDRKFIQEDIVFVDSSFFDVFPFKLLEGDRDQVLLNPKSIVLTESVAKKFFGDKNAIGEIIKVNDAVIYTVTGVMEDVPPNSHLQFKLLVSMDLTSSYSRFFYRNNWGNISMYSYVLLAENADYLKLQEKFDEFKVRHTQELIDQGVHFDLFLQPLADIHLYSDLDNEVVTRGDITYVYLFSAIAIFILIIACINYMNLASARSFSRAKEVGMRKIHGAARSQLIRQFLGESLLFSLIAFIISLVIVQITLPIFNNLVYQQQGGTDLFSNKLAFIGFFVVITFIVGIVAGSYPAFYVSSFSPIITLKGEKMKGKRRSILRNALVVIQFSIAVALIICTSVIYTQLNFMLNKDLGFDGENRILIQLRSEAFRNKSDVLKSEFKGLSNIELVSLTNSAPGIGMGGLGYYPEGADQTTPVIIYRGTIDDQFIETMGMEIVEGRNFSHEFGTDTMAVLINQELARRYSWDEPIGKKLSVEAGDNLPKIDYKVVGVIKDFHFMSLLAKVEPQVYHYAPSNLPSIILKLNPQNKEMALKQVEEKWAELSNNAPFNYIFIDENFKERYISYIRMGKLFTAFTLVAIFVACIGLFGLASFLTEIRTKEIGIRKVQGAGMFKILRLLNTDFIKWVLVANVIAWPVAYYYMTEWLANFSYTVSLSWVNFALSALLSVIIALITVSYQSLKIATNNPIESLRYE